VRSDSQPSGRTFVEEARRAQLVQTAIDVLAAHGYERASLAAIDHLETLVAAGLESGEFAALDPAAVALAVRGAIDAVPGRLAADPDLDLERWGEQLSTIFERAVSAR
jgi:hypothetical protein